VRADGTVVVHSGKVDLGTGHRIAMRQMVGEELDLGVDRIELIEGDTALTPNQGPTAGSTGVMRGGVELRQAAATAREALLALAAERLQRPAGELSLADGTVRAADGRSVAFAALLGSRGFDVKMNPKAALKPPARYAIVGKSLPRPDIPAKVTGRHVFVHDFVVPGMLHGRVLRAPAVGAKVEAVDESSVAALPGVRVVRIADFVGVVAADEWAAVRAARELRVRWSESAQLIGSDALERWAKSGPFVAEETLVAKGAPERVGALADAADALRATYAWPIQSHGSIGPSCAVADVRADGGTVWTASQATHRFLNIFAGLVELPREKLRVVYLDGAGCYGMNGHDDAAADAVLLSKAVGRPVRVQWSRGDELGWDPKGPAAAARDARLAHRRRPHRRLAHRHVGAARDREPRMDPAARAARRGNEAAGRTARRPRVAERRSAVPRAGGARRRALARPGAAAAVEHPRAGQGRELLRRRELRRRARREGEGRSARVPRPRPRRPARHRGDAPRRADDRLAAAAFACAAQRRQRRVGPRHRLHPLQAQRDLRRRRDGGRRRSRERRDRGAPHLLRARLRADDQPGCGARAGRRQPLADALAHALRETTFDRSRVTSVDWASYRLLRFPQVPRLDIALIDRPELPPLGAGEAASTPVPAALANAVFDATGVRLRSVPLTSAKLKALLA
jgi:CO/xanthine dehydrogenase Mo-binding subunit